MNITDGRDGSKKVSLETRAMFAVQMAAGQVYRNELAHLLRERGYDVEFDPRRGLFEIRGVPKDLITDMSQRAEQIERSEEHTSELQSLMRISYAVFCLKKKKQTTREEHTYNQQTDMHKTR